MVFEIKKINWHFWLLSPEGGEVQCQNVIPHMKPPSHFEFAVRIPLPRIPLPLCVTLLRASSKCLLSIHARP